jgi:hypothetical protein
MTAAPPLARYSAVEGALASGFVTAELHHAVGHDHLLCWSDVAWDVTAIPHFGFK